ncbi:MAG: co-chaperone GroES [Tissierellia bacterium]|nr:co-chaperone GroES [Tissierellia bacterium]
MTLKPIGDKIVVQMMESEKENKTASGIVLPSSEKEQPQIAKVLAVGEDIINDEEKKGTVAVGDRVIYSKYSGTEVKLDDEEYIIIKYEDLLAVVEG